MHTIGIWAQVGHDISHSDVDDPKEALILLFEFLLIKHLYRKDTTFVRSAMDGGELCVRASSRGPCEEATMFEGDEARKREGFYTNRSSHSNKGSASAC